jgi:tetratricopeptide (TPR) repeat protein
MLTAADYLDNGINNIRMEEYSKALLSLEKAIQLDKKLNSAYFHLGVALRCLNRFNEAKIAFESLPMENGKATSILLNLFYCYSALDHKEKALLVCNKLVEIYPKDETPYYYRAIIKRKLGDIDGYRIDNEYADQIRKGVVF